MSFTLLFGKLPKQQDLTATMFASLGKGGKLKVSPAQYDLENKR
jgi:hypothetical protein